MTLIAHDARLYATMVTQDIVATTDDLDTLSRGGKAVPELGNKAIPEVLA